MIERMNLEQYYLMGAEFIGFELKYAYLISMSFSSCFSKNHYSNKMFDDNFQVRLS